jgi:hypothetical protein
MTNNDAHRFITDLEDRGGVWSWRYGVIGDDWLLNLDRVPCMTDREAGEIAAAAFEIRDAIRAVLLSRRSYTSHAIQ